MSSDIICKTLEIGMLWDYVNTYLPHEVHLRILKFLKRNNMFLFYDDLNAGFFFHKNDIDHSFYFIIAYHSPSIQEKDKNKKGMFFILFDLDGYLVGRIEEVKLEDIGYSCWFEYLGRRYIIKPYKNGSLSTFDVYESII